MPMLVTVLKWLYLLLHLHLFLHKQLTVTSINMTCVCGRERVKERKMCRYAPSLFACAGGPV